MEKRNFVFALCVVFILGFLIFSNVRAEILGAEDNAVGEGVQAGGQKAQEFSESDNKTDYLKSEWFKLLSDKPFIGSAINMVNSFFGFMDPFFRVVLGVEYSLSWMFIFAVVIWFILFFIISPICSALFGSKLFGALASFAIVSLVGLSGVIRIFVGILVLAITNVWIAWIAFFITLVIGFVLVKIDKNVIASMKKQSENEQLARDKSIIHADAEVSQQKLESQSD